MWTIFYFSSFCSRVRGISIFCFFLRFFVQWLCFTSIIWLRIGRLFRVVGNGTELLGVFQHWFLECPINVIQFRWHFVFRTFTGVFGDFCQYDQVPYTLQNLSICSFRFFFFFRFVSLNWHWLCLDANVLCSLSMTIRFFAGHLRR